MSIFVKNALEGKPIGVFGDGKQTRSFTYVSDAVDATIKAQENGKTAGEALNIGIQKETSILELAKKVIKFTGSRAGIEHKAGLVGDTKRRCPDIKKTKKILGWEAKVSLDEGLKKTVEWFKSQ